MIIKHEGYSISGMVGGVSAFIVEKNATTAPYVEITLDKVSGSYDLDGLNGLIQDLKHVHALSRQVDECNARNREDQT